MVDFKKMRAQKKMLYTYRCARCGTETEYVCKLPDSCLYDHVFRANRNGQVRLCGGKLELVQETAVGLLRFCCEENELGQDCSCRLQFEPERE